MRSSSYLTVETDSKRAAAAAVTALEGAFQEQPLRAVIVYATMNHDHPAILRTLRAALGAEVTIVGCSAQGAMCDGVVREGGFVLAVMGLGGSELRVASAVARDIGHDTGDKGRALGESVRAKLGDVDPRLVVLLYDPLCGADVEQLLQGVRAVTPSPVIGGGAGQPFGRMIRTYQFDGDEIIEHSAIALGLHGPFELELGVCHGTSPAGVEMTLTRVEGNKIFEIDGRPALDVWREVTGCTDAQVNDQEYVSSWAVGVRRSVEGASGDEGSLYVIRAAFGFDLAVGALILQAAIPEGTRVMFHLRTIPDVTEGTRHMALDLARRLSGKHPWCVLGFECGARTAPFLGQGRTAEENVALRRAVAPETPWLGLLAWGEIAPLGETLAFHNYTYPLVVLNEV